MRQHQMMRTTLDIEEDVLQAAKELARREGSTAGKVISALARQGLMAPGNKAKASRRNRNGVPVLSSLGELITLEHVRKIMEEEGI
jgi:hypothetical protein